MEEQTAQEDLISKHASAALAAGAKLASLEMAQELWVDVATEAVAKQREVEARIRRITLGKGHANIDV